LTPTAASAVGIATSRPKTTPLIPINTVVGQLLLLLLLLLVEVAAHCCS
jgi:hypothetical protein